MPSKDELEKENAKLQRRIKFLENAVAKENYQLEQLLGKALGYPEYPPEFDAPEGDVCVGEHIIYTLVQELIESHVRTWRELQSYTPVYYRAIWEKGATRPTVSFWRDRLTWKEPFDEFGKQLFVREL